MTNKKLSPDLEASMKAGAKKVWQSCADDGDLGAQDARPTKRGYELGFHAGAMAVEQRDAKQTRTKLGQSLIKSAEEAIEYSIEHHSPPTQRAEDSETIRDLRKENGAYARCLDIGNAKRAELEEKYTIPRLWERKYYEKVRELVRCEEEIAGLRDALVSCSPAWLPPRIRDKRRKALARSAAELLKYRV